MIDQFDKYVNVPSHTFSKKVLILVIFYDSAALPLNNDLDLDHDEAVTPDLNVYLRLPTPDHTAATFLDKPVVTTWTCSGCCGILNFCRS